MRVSAPSPSRATCFVSDCVTCSSATSSSARLTTPAAPLAKTIAVSDVDVSVSTETQLNVRSITRRQIASSTSPSTLASVKTMVIKVAIFGSIIPTPLATPTTRAGPEPIIASAILCTVSVVMMPRATESASLLGNGNGKDANPVRTFSMGYWRPMTPVEAINTSCGSHPSLAATPCTTSRALASPRSPVATLAFFEMTITARAE